MSRIEQGGVSGERAQRELIPLLSTLEDRRAALGVIIIDLRVSKIIPELQDGLVDWVVNLMVKEGLVDQEDAGVLSYLSSSLPNTSVESAPVELRPALG
jgi:hypothetical protein